MDIFRATSGYEIKNTNKINPKDTQQLKANYSGIPNRLISAIVYSNKTRKKYITEMIKKSNPKTVGIYKLAMKVNSDNFRFSAIIEIV